MNILKTAGWQVVSFAEWALVSVVPPILAWFIGTWTTNLFFVGVLSVLAVLMIIWTLKNFRTLADIDGVDLAFFPVVILLSDCILLLSLWYHAVQ